MIWKLKQRNFQQSKTTNKNDMRNKRQDLKYRMSPRNSIVDKISSKRKKQIWRPGEYWKKQWNKTIPDWRNHPSFWKSHWDLSEVDGKDPYWNIFCWSFWKDNLNNVQNEKKSEVIYKGRRIRLTAVFPLANGTLLKGTKIVETFAR